MTETVTGVMVHSGTVIDSDRSNGTFRYSD